MNVSGEPRITWAIVRQALTRPYPMTWPMILFVSFIPFYLVIAERSRDLAVRGPEMALDRLLPVVPVWALVYGALYFFLILLPVFVVQQKALIDRTVWAYVVVWTLPYACFLVCPTVQAP